MAGKPSLRNAGVTPTRGKTIRVAGTLLVRQGLKEAKGYQAFKGTIF
jgi:hypothetical protein